MKVFCLIEQSGTFKNVFKEFGYEAWDCDILDDFGQTDFKVDLFADILNEFEYMELVKRRKEKDLSPIEISKSLVDYPRTIFDKISKDDLVFAFFSCIKFTEKCFLNTKCKNSAMKNYTNAQKLAYSRHSVNEIAKYYEALCKLCEIATHKGFKLIIENKLKRLTKNKSAVNALNALKAEIKAQRKRYNDMRALWNSEDLSKNVGLCKINNEFKRKIGAQTNIIKISAETIEAHKENSKYVPPKGVKKPNPHPEITAFDYSIIPFMIENKNKELYKDGEKTYIVASKMNVWYRLALKNLPDKKEIWVVSLMSRATKEELMPNLKNKKEIK